MRSSTPPPGYGVEGQPSPGPSAPPESSISVEGVPPSYQASIGDRTIPVGSRGRYAQKVSGNQVVSVPQDLPPSYQNEGIPSAPATSLSSSSSSSKTSNKSSKDDDMTLPKPPSATVSSREASMVPSGSGFVDIPIVVPAGDGVVVMDGRGNCCYCDYNLINDCGNCCVGVFKGCFDLCGSLLSNCGECCSKCCNACGDCNDCNCCTDCNCNCDCGAGGC